MSAMHLSGKHWRTGWATRPTLAGPRGAAVPMVLKELTGERRAIIVRKAPAKSTNTLANIWPTEGNE